MTGNKMMEGQSLSSESLSHLLYYVKNGKVVKEAKQNMVWNYILPSPKYPNVAQ